MNHHLFIAGTGRAGTTFLVQYLTSCGLETQLSLHPEARLNEHANAGLEDYPSKGAHLPYVIKSPWLYEFVDQLLERNDVTIDAVIMPMRDLVEAASSRVILEMRSRYGDDRLNDDVRQWETWGWTPGGMVYSMNPIDQARLLALGFHDAVFALVKKQIPIVFVDFERMIADAEYAWSALEPALKHKTDRARALAAHAKTADASKIRVGAATVRRVDDQMSGVNREPSPVMHVEHPSMARLDRAAILRELNTVRSAHEQANHALAQQTERANTLDLRLNAVETQQMHQSDALDAELNILRAQLARAREALTAANANAERERLNFAQQRALERGKVTKTEGDLRALQEQYDRITAHAHTLTMALRELETSNSWKLTRPLRGLSMFLRSLFWRLSPRRHRH
ncbi:hypothetical protein [Caballeronia sp. BR00000012568055]|uniref:hypothetical protein n=1 Tax=Caballeronia sp. BR00000012568055 TaxID=2918761 RepID=UPI0023F87E40|nr:hypothetical protein [Caballeronia sp. BR00000012568055]